MLSSYYEKLITKGENPLTIWGDGKPVRDFIHCDDVASGMIKTVENNVNGPINLGSGTGTSIRELVEIIINNAPVKPNVKWDTTKAIGDEIRVLDTTKAVSYGIESVKSLDVGIKETIDWYIKNNLKLTPKYNAFLKK